MCDISVIIPVYNGAGMLEDCVSSVLNAGNRIAEIIIVDDGSTDQTLSVAEGLAEKNMKIRVIHTENHGTYMARTMGMKAARGSYVTSIDVDDRYCPNSLDMLADLLEDNAADAAIGGLVEIDDYDTMISAPDCPVVKVSTVEQMWPRIMKWKTQEFVSYINKLYKREMMQDFVEAEGICQGDDVTITCQTFLGVKTVVETNSPMYLYYQNPESLTRVGFSDRDLDVQRVWDKVVEIMGEKRKDLLPMAQYNRWRTDFTMMTRLILVDDKTLDRKYAGELQKWRAGLKAHWKDLIAPHAMPRNRELLVLGLRFCYGPTKAAMRLGRKLMRKETSVILHSGDKRPAMKSQV